MTDLKTLKLVAAIALVAPGGWLAAQQQTAVPPVAAAAAAPAKTGKAEIAGVVVDSLHWRFLRGADVIIEGTDARTVTDSAGRFSLDGLPPGTPKIGQIRGAVDWGSVDGETAAHRLSVTTSAS